MVVDIGESETAYGVGPVEAFELLCTELREYARLREQETLFNQLMDKMILVGNKADVPGAREHWQQLEQHLSITNNPVKRLAVSAQQEKNLDALVEMLTVS
jgi:GTPase involved in cell partitioning and DNA repair